MPDYPQAALDAAAMALHRIDCRGDGVNGCMADGACDGKPFTFETDAARAALDAAAPLLAESVAEKILAHMEKYEPPGATGTRWRARRRHFSIAARIAAGAFTIREESLRMAAEAIARGDFMSCPAPEGEQ